MATSSYPPAVRLTAERLAGEWLREHGFCDCAIQQQTIALRLLPVMAMYEAEIHRDTNYDRAEFRHRVAIYLTRAHDTLKKGLHRPGQSAGETEWR